MSGQPVRKAMKPSQPILAVQSRWPQEDSYCFELRRRRLPQQTPQKSPSTATPTVEQENKGDQKPALPLKQESDDQKQLQGKEEVEEKKNLLEKDNSELTSKIQKLEQEKQAITAVMQEKLTALSLEKQRLEEHVLILKSTTTKKSDDAPSSNEDTNPAQVLEEVQSRYEAEVQSLTNELREKERLQQEMDTAFSEMVSLLKYEISL